MKTVYERPKVFTDAQTTYCGGCGHGIVGKLIAELIDEMGIGDIWLASLVRRWWKPKKGPIPDSVYLIGYKLERCSMLKEWLGQAPEE